MPFAPPSRTIIITSILIAAAAVAVSADWAEVSRPATTDVPLAPLVLPAITSFDAALIERHFLGIPPPLTGNQLVVADVSNNGSIDAPDVIAVERYVVGLNTGTGSTGNMVPPALLMGDVSGNGTHYDGSPGTSGISLPIVSATPGGIVIIPMSVSNVSGLGIISYDLQVDFNPAIVTPASPGFASTGTLSNGMSVITNAGNTGHLIISAVSQGGVLTGSGTLINLRFNVVGTAGQSTALAFSDFTDSSSRLHPGFVFDEGMPSSTTTNGSLTIPNTQAVWTGSTGNWSDPANWSTNPNYPDNGQPNVSDLYDAVLANGGTILRDVPISIQNFDFMGGTVDGSSPLTMYQTFNWSGGLLTGNGNINIAGGSVMTISGDNSTVLNTTLNNVGTINVGNANLHVFSAGNFRNNDGGVFDIQNTGNVFSPLGGAIPFANNGNGTVRKSSTGQSDFDIPMINNGIVELHSGVLNFSAGYSQPSGALSFQGGSVSAGGTGFTIDGGQIVGNGTFNGSVDQNGGTMSPGFSIGTIEVTGPYTFEANSTYVCQLDSSNVSRNKLLVTGSSDKVRANGVTVAGGSVSTPDIGRPGIRPDATVPLGTVFLLIDNTSASPIAGEFSGLPEGSFIVVNGNTYKVSYVGGDGNDMTLTSVGISGTVTYGNAVGSPATRFISNVSINGMGSPSISAVTGAPGPNAGKYVLSGFGTGSYMITPAKTGGTNGAINSFDAARIAQHVVGTNILTGNQLAVADVSGNGNVNSFDAAQLARFVINLPPYGFTGMWRFTPLNRTHASITSNITGDDYSGLLMGDVSGNWMNTGARSAIAEPGHSISITAPKTEAEQNKQILIPVTVRDAANKEIIAYEFDLRYDPTVIKPTADPVVLRGTVSTRLAVAANPTEPGLLRVVVYGAFPITDDGVLFDLKFTAVGDAGTSSPLTWERFIFNDGVSDTITENGQIEIKETY